MTTATATPITLLHYQIQRKDRLGFPFYVQARDAWQAWGYFHAGHWSAQRRAYTVRRVHAPDRP